MRNPNSRLKVDTVYILGAGASFAASQGAKNTAPLDKDFTNRLCDLTYKRPAWVSHSQKDLLASWADHRPFDTFGLENAIICQASHHDFFKAIHPRRSRGISLTREQFVDNIAHLIAFVLSKAREHRSEPYGRLAQLVCPCVGFPPKRTHRKRTRRWRRYLPNDRFITFNYDTLLDQHLLKRYKPQQVYFDAIADDRDGDRVFTGKERNPLLIKLHGSINWRCSTDEYGTMLDPPQQEEPYPVNLVWTSDSGTAPDDDVSPCIIPPLPSKPLAQIKLFRFLWTRACEYLHEARQIVICGYSLPPTDSMAMSLFGNIRNKKLERVTVVDPNPAILTRWRELLIHKPNSIKEWVYNADFLEYVDSLKQT